MGVSKYISDVKIISHPIEVVYNYLSDFRNLSQYINDEVLSALSEKVPQVAIRNFESDNDCCRFEVGSFGSAEIRIVDRTPYTTIKIRGEGKLPVELNFWIQLLPQDGDKAKMRLTLHAEMGMLVKLMVGNKLEEGINRLADALVVLPYA